MWPILYVHSTLRDMRAENCREYSRLVRTGRVALVFTAVGRRGKPRCTERVDTGRAACGCAERTRRVKDREKRDVMVGADNVVFLRIAPHVELWHVPASRTDKMIEAGIEPTTACV